MRAGENTALSVVPWPPFLLVCL